MTEYDHPTDRNRFDRPNELHNMRYAGSSSGGRMGTLIALASILAFFGLVLYFAGGSPNDPSAIRTGSTTPAGDTLNKSEPMPGKTPEDGVVVE